MAVLLAAERTQAVSLFGNTLQTFFGRDFADEKDLLGNQYDLMGSGEPSAVANSQIHYGADVKVFIEDQPLLRGYVGDEAAIESLTYWDVKLLVDKYALNDFGDSHSLVLIIDSLNVQNTMLQLVPEAKRSQAQVALNSILNSASWANSETDYNGGQGKAEGDVLENVVNYLAKMFLGGGAGGFLLDGSLDGNTWHLADSRESLYRALKEIQNSPVYKDLLGKVDLVVSSADAEVARNDFAQFLALYYLAPFALKMDDATALKSVQGELAVAWESDSKLQPAGISGGLANFTDVWLQDRAKFLSHKLQLGANNVNPVDPDLLSRVASDPGLAASNYDLTGTIYFDLLGIFYEDVSSGYRIALGFDPNDIPDAKRQYRFGAEDSDTFTGGKEADHLYGMGGNDTLKGEAGHDYLEGGSGNDHLHGGIGNDTLNGGTGNDTLDGGAGSDILKGGAGHDTYTIDGSAGNDTIIDINVDEDGGTIKYKEHVLSGGKAISAGAQQWKDDHVTYSVVSDGGIQNLIITVGANTVTVLDWKPGRFGIQLIDAEEPTPIDADWVIEGDKKPIDFDASKEGVQTEEDELGNIKTDPDKDDPDRYDYLKDSAGNDKLLGKGGNDVLDAQRGGNDLLDGGSGDDWLMAGDGDDTLIGGSGSDRLGGQAGDDRLYADEQVTDEQAFVANGIDNGIAERGSRLSGDADKDFLVGGQRQDLLLGGSGRDILLGGAGDDVLYGDSQATWSTADWAVGRRVETDEESQITTYSVEFVDMGTMVPSESDEDGDFLYGGTGADWLFGESGQDYLDGGASDDVLFGGRDSDWLVGGDGSDVLVGDSGITPTGLDGDDLLIGGAGDDTLVGDGGNDILHGGDDHDLLSGDNDKIDPALHGDDHLDGGSGNDKLYGHGGADTLEGGEGHDLLLGDQMEQALAGAHHARDVLHGGAGNDTLFGTGSDDELYGGDDDDVLNGDADASQLSGQYHGNDLLDGGSGNDQLWGNGGRDTLYGGAGNDRLVGDADGLAEEFHGNDRLYAGAGNDSIWGGGGDDLLDGDEGDDQLVGDSGNDTLVSGSGDDRLWGGEGDDRLDGGSGFDYLDGGEGDDTYVFNLGDGHLSVEGNTEFIQDNAGANSLEFGAGIHVDAVQLTQYPGMLQLRYSAEDSLILMGGLASGVSTIKFADGSVFSLEALYARNSQDSADQSLSVPGAQLVGSASGNQLTGTGGGSTFRGGRGDDTLSGAGGGNLYLYERGDGTDHIYDTGGNSLADGTPAPNRVQFGTGIRPQDVSLAPGKEDTLEVLIAGDPSGKLIIHGFDANDAVNSSVIDYFDFADGTSLSYAELLGSGFQVIGSTDNDNLLGSNLADLLQGNTGNDTLSAGGGDDVLQGGEGDDLLIGGAGADLYLYAKGQGSDTLVETADGSINTLRFAAGLDPEDIELGAGADQSLLLKIVSSGDTLVLASWLVSATPLIQRIEFADGTVWTPEWIRQNLKVQSGTAGNDVLSALFGQSAILYGLAGSDTLNGSSDDDQLVGGVGNDSLVGGLGNDRYLIELGDGLDTLVESGGQDSVLYGAGIAASDVSVTRVGTDLLLTHINGSDKLTIKGWFSYADGRAWVEEIRFADGSVWSADELTRQVLTQVGTEGNDNLKGSENFGDTLSGGAGSDALYGYSGDDSLSGGAGYDYLYGGNGNDTLTVGGAVVMQRAA